MSTGTFSNQLSFVRRHGYKAAGLAVLSLGLFLGGCNNKLKDENEELRAEQATLKEKVNSTESEKAALAAQLQQTQSEKDHLSMELASARTVAQAPTQPYYPPSGEPTPRKNHQGSGGEQTFVIAGDTLFASGSATLKNEAKKSIDALLPQIKAAGNVRVEGYTDSDPITKSKAKYPTNQALSKARADAVKSYLVTKGISGGKIATVGKGASDPKATKKDSRRVEIVVAE